MVVKRCIKFLCKKSIHSVGVNAELNRAWRDSKPNLLVNPDEVLKNLSGNFIIFH